MITLNWKIAPVLRDPDGTPTGPWTALGFGKPRIDLAITPWEEHRK